MNRERLLDPVKSYMKQQNAKYGRSLTRIPSEAWPSEPRWHDPKRIGVFRSRDFLAQVFQEADGVVRISANRTDGFDGHTFTDGISWDDLQFIKRECGYGDLDAVEVFPADRDIVNVANMRHLFVLPYTLPFAWRKAARVESLLSQPGASK